MLWIIVFDHNAQYVSGAISISYQVLPSRRVRPPGSAIRRNSPRRERKYPCRCGGSTSLYQLSSCIGSGEWDTSKARRFPGSQAVIGSTNGPVEKTQ